MVARLGYMILGAQEPEQWATFGTDILGLMSVAASDGDDSVYLKMDDHPFRLAVEKSDTDRLKCVGWEVESAADLEETVRRLEAAGVDVQRGEQAGAARRKVAAFASATDPAGNGFELYHAREQDSLAFESPQGVSRFLTGDMGMGHVVIPAPNIDEVHDFYCGVMGFGDSDDLHLPPPAEGAPNQRVVFMHAANPRHHSLALYNFPVPTGIVHMMFEVPTVDDVGTCLDRVQAADLPLMATLGRHCNDNMLSFYVVGPGGMAVEYGCEGLQLDWDEFTPTKSTQGDHWGHAYQPLV